MAANTTIAWATDTFNPWIGCSKVHVGCTHCYAETFSKRTGKAEWGPNGSRVKTVDRYWRQALKWNREAATNHEIRRVFCASLADVFEDWPGEVTLVGDDLTMCCPKCGNGQGMPLIQRQFGPPKDQCPRCGAKMQEPTLDGLRRMLFDVIDGTPNLDWLLLTKRPQNIRKMWAPKSDKRPIFPGAPGKLGEPLECVVQGAMRRNVWLGTSISNQPTTDEFLPELAKCRDLAPVLFLSAEPLLARIDLATWFWSAMNDQKRCVIDQVIIGVESSGPRLGSLGEFKSESAWIDGAISIVEQCKAAGVAAFVKQIPVKGKLSHDPDEWPADLRVREFPQREVARG